MNEFEKVLASIPDVDPAVYEREELQARVAASREVLQRLPEFVRACAPRDLEARVKAPQMLGAVRAWGSAGADGGLLLMGPSRSGKSTCAAWLYRRLVAEGLKQGGPAWGRALSLGWWAASDLEAAQNEHGLGKGPCPSVLEACHASLLFLDDAGWDRDPRVCSEVLATRYERQRPTVVTTARNREQLQLHYGPAVVRRLLESGGPGATRVVDAFAKGAA